MKKTFLFRSKNTNKTSQELKQHGNIVHHSIISISALLFLCFCLSIVLLTPDLLKPVLSNTVFFKESLPAVSNTSTPTVIIDAGHGGKDPGKVSDAGTLEKELNLRIALILKNLLEAQDINVIMTRDTDTDLAISDSKRKLSDMKERIKLIEESNAHLVIGIHQNSYPDSDVYGAQCFYLSGSDEGMQIASFVQEQIITSTNQTKIREIKDNGDYYLLKHSPLPTVIVECGFLSNPTEEQLLLTNEYQRKLAWGIHLGILQYIKNN